MIFSILSSILLTAASSLIIATNPLTAGLTILIISLTVASSYAIIVSSWFAFLIFLIYVGGILVIFAYFTALSPNQTNISSYHLLLILLSLLIFLALPPILNFKPLITNFNSFHVEFLYFNINSPILVLAATILLFVIVIVVKISSVSSGPLRSFISYVQTCSHYSSCH
jgi:NADH-ubiquinone oxidoreductase chain 6